MKKLKITLTRSLIGNKKDQRATVRALGLGKIGTFAVQEDNPTIRGMVPLPLSIWHSYVQNRLYLI